jgi:hypothetical protein
MSGAIAGDVIGSVHEAAATKTKRYPLFTPESCFTDDTLLTAAVAEVPSPTATPHGRSTGIMPAGYLAITLGSRIMPSLTF